MRKHKDIWFPAKKYGYGWGLPCTWQGWLVFIVYLALVASPIVFCMDHIHPAAEVILYFCFAFFVTVVFIFICYKKGEKPRWRWGGK